MNYNAFLENRGKYFVRTAVKRGDGMVCVTNFGALSLSRHVWTLARGRFERKLVDDIGGYGVMHEHCKIEPLVEFIFKVDQWTKVSLVVEYVTNAHGHTFICVQRNAHGWFAIARTNKPEDALLMREFFCSRRSHDKEGFGFCASNGRPHRIINYRPDLLDAQTIVYMYGYWLRWAERSIGGPALHYGNWVGEVKHGVGSGKVAVEALMNTVRSRIIDRPLEKSAVKNVPPETPKSPTPDQFQAGMTLPENMQWHRDEYDRLASWQVEKLRKAGKYEEARELLEKIIVIVGDKPESLAASYVKLGELLQTLQEHQSASQAFRRALALEPTDRRNWYVAHHNLAVCLMEMRQYREAEAFLRQAIRIEPEWHDAYTDLGRTLTSLEQYAEAAKLFVKATILSPYYPDALHYLEDLLDEHEVVFLQIPEIKAEMEKCRQLVNRRRGVA